MSKKVIGILGGMGPEATLDCFGKIIRNTPARLDRDHLRVIIDSNPTVPDRILAITGGGESPVPAIVAGCRVLEKAGADFIIIPCVSAHIFLDEIRAQSDLPILSIFDAVADAIIRDHPDINRVGLLATTGTIKGGLFQQRLARDGITTVVPDDAVQSKITAAIADIKMVQPLRNRSEITADLVAAAQSLILRKPDSVQAIVAGCTEIPLALSQAHLPVPYLECVTILARAAIFAAGLTPLPSPIHP